LLLRQRIDSAQQNTRLNPSCRNLKPELLGQRLDFQGDDAGNIEAFEVAKREHFVDTR
jgi:hypothetical protein